MQNTYGIQVYNQSLYDTLVDNFEKPGGHREALLRCHALAAEKDPFGHGGNEEVVAACQKASETMSGMIWPYFEKDEVCIPLALAHV